MSPLKAMDEGYRDGLSNPDAQNRYARGCQAHQEWEIGWQKAMREQGGWLSIRKLGRCVLLVLICGLFSNCTICGTTKQPGEPCKAYTGHDSSFWERHPWIPFSVVMQGFHEARE